MEFENTTNRSYRSWWIIYQLTFNAWFHYSELYVIRGYGSEPQFDSVLSRFQPVPVFLQALEYDGQRHDPHDLLTRP